MSDDNDKRHKINFVGAEKLGGDLPLRVKIEFEKTATAGILAEFDTEIDLEWDFEEGALYFSREIFDFWEEDSEEVLNLIRGFFNDAVEEIAEQLEDEEGEIELSDHLRDTYLTEDWDKEPV